MSRWRTLQFDFQAMASPCRLQIDGQDERSMRRAAKAAMAEVKRIENKFSRYRESSVISRINHSAGQTWTELDSETEGLMAFAEQLWTLSDGLFDATSGVLRKVWNFKGTQLPEPAALQALLGLIGWQHVERKGKLVRGERRWTLTIEQRGYDVLFSSLPWSFSVIKPAWMPDPLYVEWV